MYSIIINVKYWCGCMMRRQRQRVSSLRKPGIRVVSPRVHWKFTFKVERVTLQAGNLSASRCHSCRYCPKLASWTSPSQSSLPLLMHKGPLLSPSGALFLLIAEETVGRDCRKRLAVAIETQLKAGFCVLQAGATAFGALAYGLCNVISSDWFFF